MERILKCVYGVLFILMVTVSSARAEEVFDFYRETKPDERTTSEINVIINREIEVFVNLMNANYADQKFLKECSMPDLNGKALDFLDHNFTRVGNRLRDLADGTIVKNRPKINFLWNKNRILDTYKFTNILGCCVPSVNIKGNVIGIDKIDHFFGNGGILYRKRLRDPKTTDAQLVQLNVNQEEATWGLSESRVKSYGDMNANWAGMNFYQDLFNNPKGYLKCEKGKLSVTRQFHIEDYVNEGWSEAINCSSFPDKKTAEWFAKNLKELDLKCPLDESKCDTLVKRYKDQPNLLRTLVSPACRLKTAQQNLVEDEQSLDWDNLRSTWGGLREKEVLKYFGITK